MVGAGALTDGSCQAGRMRVRGADCVVPARREAPADDALHVERALALHPIEDRRPQSIGRLGVPAIRGTICRSGNVGNDRCPAACGELVGAYGVVRPVFPVSHGLTKMWLGGTQGRAGLAYVRRGRT
jgi:hypothetical protein